MRFWKFFRGLVLLVAASLASGAFPQAERPAVRVVSYRVDRGDPGRIVSNEMTYRLQLGGARSARILAGGQPVPHRIDKDRKWAVFTTSATTIEARLEGAETKEAGQLEVAPLYDDRKWAWSHGFDDNVNFKRHGIPAFEEKGWRGTVFLIGKEIPEGEGERYILGAEDLRGLARRGWGIGNHGWLHQSFRQLGGREAAVKDAMKCQQRIAEIVRPAVPGYAPFSFAAPMNDSSFGKLAEDFPAEKGLPGPRLFECGNSVPLRVDPGHFSPNKKLGRRDISKFRDVKKEMARIAAKCDGDARFWYNTLAHGCDGDHPKGPLYKLVDWAYRTYGPEGTNEVWVAPSERVYSYLCLRDSIRIRRAN